MRRSTATVLALGLIAGAHGTTKGQEPSTPSAPASNVGQFAGSALGSSTAVPMAVRTRSIHLLDTPALCKPEDLISSDWDDGKTDVSLRVDFQPSLAQDGDSEANSLRRELREAVGQLQAAQLQLQQTRQELIQHQAPAEDQDDGGRRISRLETAFDSFRRQLSNEGPGAYPSARITGFTQLDDYALYQDPRSKATVGTGQNGVGFRRGARGGCRQRR